MALPQDLLRQARHLATKEKRRPQQASLRRAISTAYYALFHLLSSEAASLVSPAQPAGIGRHIQRALTHGDMKNAAKGISQPNLGRPYSALISTAVLPELADVARHFVTLQEERHAADYDINRIFDRLHALAQVSLAEAAFKKWASVRGKPQANVFLMMLFFGKALSAR